MSRLNLKDVEWKEFLFRDVFNIVDGYYNKKPPLEKGNIPFLGATQYNNGITEFYSKSTILKYDRNGFNNDKGKLYSGNCIAITNNGSVGYAYYQTNSFSCSHDITLIYLKKDILNKYIANFLIVPIQQTGKSFEYAKKWRPKRMRNSSLMLPSKNNKPDWQFMEDYMRQVEQDLLEKETIYFKNKLTKNTNVKSLNEVEWKDFKIVDVFNIIERGKRLTKNNQIKGSKPYISSTALDNGLDNFIANDKNVRNFENCLTIANSGSVGKVFFHPYKLIASDHVTALKNNNLTQYQYLFLLNMIEKIKDKYSFNREINNERIKSEKILLPITKKGLPDWQYMHDYMKNIENNKINEWLEKKKNQIS